MFPAIDCIVIIDITPQWALLTALLEPYGPNIRLMGYWKAHKKNENYLKKDNSAKLFAALLQKAAYT